jgi:hypothetical protein
MNIKHIIKEEIESFVNEELVGDKLYGYHVTGVKSSEDIFKSGFKIGLGAMEGEGLYAFYNLKRAGGYATKDMGESRIIKFEIQNPKKILVLNNIDVAKQIHGKNYMIFNQLKNIINDENKINELIVKSAKAVYLPPNEYVKMVNEKFLEDERDWYVWGSQTALSNDIIKSGDGILDQGTYGYQFILNNPRAVNILGYYIAKDLELLPDFHPVEIDPTTFDSDIRIKRGTYNY